MFVDQMAIKGRDEILAELESVRKERIEMQVALLELQDKIKMFEETEKSYSDRLKQLKIEKEELVAKEKELNNL